MGTPALNPRQRARSLQALESATYDVLVIGGGITGAGAALDAASRGLSVALVEARDLASGTSSRSGKMFHGGLRYLEQLNFSLVREALVERDLMVDRLCPHLVEPERFIIPFTHRWERPYIGSGVLLYDLLRLTGPRSVRGHRHLSRATVQQQMPALRTDAVTGGVQYFDVRVDDARHTMTVARTAARYGAEIVTQAPVVAVEEDNGVVRGVRIRDELSGREIEVSARSVINAAGVWADNVQQLSGKHTIEVTPAKGIHLVVPQDRIDARAGLMTKTADSVFIFRKWFDYWLLGTTDTKWEHSRDEPAATAADVDYLLQQANRWLARPLTRDDVVGIYAGLRPLVSGRGASTAALSRDHTVLEQPVGFVTVVGGKYTTYRIMARDAVDRATRRLGRVVPASATETLPLEGAVGYDVVCNQRELLARDSGLEPAWIEHLLRRYGADITAVLDLIADRPELGRPLTGAPGYLAAEVVYAAANEGALHLDDVLVRRTRAAMEAGEWAAKAVEEAARLAGEVLDWDEDQRRAEMERYQQQVEADRLASHAADDAAAVRARAHLG